MDRMKTDYSNSRRPQWAETLLRLLLTPEHHESLLRASWAWGAILGAALVIRYLFDTLAPPTDYKMRATVLTYTIIAACLLASFSAVCRTRSMRAGVLTSLSAATVGALFSIVGTGLMLAVWHDPATLDAWRRSGGLEEAFIDVPLKLIALGVTIGALGAVLGKAVARGLATEVKTGT